MKSILPPPADNGQKLLEMFLSQPAPHERLSLIMDACADMDLDRRLSPTRLRGLAALEEQIHRLAKS